MTSTQHGAQIGGASNPCETLYKLLMEVRRYEKVETTGKGWEEIYMEIVKRKDQVMRKGKEEKKKPKIVNWVR